MVKLIVRVIMFLIALYYMTAAVGGLINITDEKKNIFKYIIPFYFWIEAFRTKKHVEVVPATEEKETDAE